MTAPHIAEGGSYMEGPGRYSSEINRNRPQRRNPVRWVVEYAGAPWHELLCADHWTEWSDVVVLDSTRHYPLQRDHADAAD